MTEDKFKVRPILVEKEFNQYDNLVISVIEVPNMWHWMASMREQDDR